MRTSAAKGKEKSSPAVACRAVLALAALGSACSDRIPSGPALPPAPSGPLLTCQVDTRAQTLSCGNPSATVTGSAMEASTDLILGGQGMYVQLRSSNVSYNASTQIFRADVTVQNLTALNLGTPDGSTVTG